MPPYLVANLGRTTDTGNERIRLGLLYYTFPYHINRPDKKLIAMLQLFVIYPVRGGIFGRWWLISSDGEFCTRRFFWRLVAEFSSDRSMRSVKGYDICRPGRLRDMKKDNVVRVQDQDRKLQIVDFTKHINRGCIDINRLVAYVSFQSFIEWKNERHKLFNHFSRTQHMERD